jgi:formamidopyrimidine-DNA glycosylase
MPELPEVETIARYLRQGTAGAPGLIGRRAAEVHLLWPRSLESPSEVELQARLPGQALQSITRRGKFLLLHFDLDTLLFHLRMSGSLIVNNGQWTAVSEQAHPYSDQQSTINDRQSKSSHVRLILSFEDGVNLIFIDPRKFGRIWLARDPGEVVGGLGPEPLDPGLTTGEFYRLVNSQRRLLKPLLLDQAFLAGLGNIYTDESLNLARLHPCQPAHLLSYTQADALLDAIRTILRQAIDQQGASIDWVYRGGNFQNHFRVYQRTGKPCLNCGSLIKRIVVGQRGTHFCPNCQVIVS